VNADFRSDFKMQKLTI